MTIEFYFNLKQLNQINKILYDYYHHYWKITLFKTVKEDTGKLITNMSNRVDRKKNQFVVSWKIAHSGDE